MTLAVAWERATPTGSELVFASDSRLRLGGTWDAGPKVFRLPRTDALIAFAGDTLWAYPIVLQTIATMDANESSRSRYYDLAAARGLAMRSMDAMMRSGDAVAGGWHDVELEFLFGGWSWRDQEFVLWRLYWSRGDRRMRHDRVPRGRLGKVRFIGTRDREGNDPLQEVVGTAKRRLSDILRRKHGQLAPDLQLDMEPWEVLIEMLRSQDYQTIGGPPQLAKVYRYMDTRTFAVRWPDADGSVTLMGRRLLDREVTHAPVIDPDEPLFAGPAADGRESQGGHFAYRDVVEANWAWRVTQIRLVRFMAMVSPAPFRKTG